MGTLASDGSGNAIGYRLEGLVIKLLHDRFVGALPVAVAGNSPQHAIKGTLGVDLPVHPSGSPTYPIDVFAAVTGDRKKLEVSVVNPSETAQDCDLNLVGVQPAGAVRVWQLTAPAGAAPPQTGPGRGPFSGPPATMAESSLPQPPRRVTVPASSITVYEFEVK